MISSGIEKRVSLDTLRDRIAETIAGNVKAYNVPSVCVRVGIQEIVEDGDADEAFRSRRVYVKRRLVFRNEPDLLIISATLLKEHDSPALAEVVSELTIHAEHRITEITRRDVLKVLNGLNTLFGDVDLFEGLNIISSEHLSYDGLDNHLNFLPSLAKEIRQHYLRNDDLSEEELLIRCGALTCSQTKFFFLLEKLLDPVVRRGDEQIQLATALNTILHADGFHAVVVGEQSRHPIYAVRRLVTGVARAMKNLIFASIGPKPELVLRDAVSNDIEITKHADMCLVFDRPLSIGGLAWVDMAAWWQEREGLPELRVARQLLGERLKRSVELTNSPGEYAIFRTYHEIFGKDLGDRLPALIPQVYLHYDPFTQNERTKLGKDQVLERQRMDFLMLLDGHVRVVIEVDGKQHYAEGDKASPRNYAKMVEEDRRLRLHGYELYRFGSSEFPDANLINSRYAVGQQSKAVVIEFFNRLFDKHKVRQ